MPILIPIAALFLFLLWYACDLHCHWPMIDASLPLKFMEISIIHMYIYYHKTQNQIKQLGSPRLVLLAIYHQEWCHQWGQSDLKYTDKYDVHHGKYFWWVFSCEGLFSQVTNNIYFYFGLEYDRMLHLFSIDQNNLWFKSSPSHRTIRRSALNFFAVKCGNQDLAGFLLEGH